MVKFVVEYSTGDYDTHHTYHYAIEADSVDEFHIKFLDAVEVWKVQAEERSKLQKDLDNARASSDVKKIQSAWKAWEDYCKSDNHSFRYSLVVDGMEFAFPDNDYDYKKQELTSLPGVYTLDEWFEMNRPQKIKGTY